MRHVPPSVQTSFRLHRSPVGITINVVVVVVDVVLVIVIVDVVALVVVVSDKRPSIADCTVY